MGIFDDLVAAHGDPVAIRLGPVLLHVFARPEHARHILQANYRNYLKDPMITGPIELFSGRTMFTSDGEEWVRRRRIMQPAFRRQRLASFAEVSVGAARRCLQRWKAHGAAPIDLQEEMFRLTLEVVGLSLFSVDLAQSASALGEAFLEGNEYAIYRIDVPFAPPSWVPTPRNRRFRDACDTIEAFLEDLLDTRQARSGEDETADLLALLLAARDEETGEGLSREQLRSEMISMFSAGHDTTASTLTWCCYLLSQHPAVEARLCEELERVLGGRSPTWGDLEALVYTRQVIDETLRLYPVAWALTRVAAGDDVIGEWAVRAGDQVTVAIAALHRRPELWDEPAAFRPERFAPGADQGRHRFQYLPFGAGPRKCIGYRLALTEATLVLATLYQAVRPRLVPGHVVQTRTVVGLHARYGMRMTLEWVGE